MHQFQSARKLLPLICAVFVWGGNWPIMKLGLAHMSPLWLAACRFGSATLVSLLVLGALGRLRRPSAAQWPLVAGVGLLQMAAFTALALWALQYVPPGRASIIAYATSVWVIPLSALWLKERLSAVQWLATLLSYAGIGMIVAPAFSPWQPQLVVGLGMLLGASFAWACNIVQLRAGRSVRLGVEMIPWQTGLACLPLIALAWLRDGAPVFLAQPEVWPLIAYTGPLATALTFIVVLTMTQRMPPVATSIAMLCVPLIGLVVSSWVFKEHLSADLLWGLVFIGASVMVSALGEKCLPRLTGFFVRAQE
ncbi:DMT family transporter [Bordetella avium]|uniref:DMT family transporter n=1 Tax=Bordetella avium TaxID=521 RepID=UPI000E67E25A|nr:DMT family transporter [Bordetella avium]RIQ69363.1 DMT family transporter [Bordetella avium]